ncbi:MAG: EAL domain-containing protein, partial [Eubacteriales bacterium]
YPIHNRMESVTQMIDGATIARNAGKQILGYTITEYTEEMREERRNKNHVVQTMNEGIQNKEFIMYYQPKINLNTGHIVGAEALVRWVQGGKLIPPDCFIPIFEKNGFIEELDYYVFEEVCAFINRQKGMAPIISVNLSWITVGKDNLIQRLEAILEKYQVKPIQIDLEITESAFVDQFEDSLSRLEHLRSLGFTISMDDFGAGISSLNRLKEIPLDIMKIDRGFVMDSLENKKGKIIIENVIQMGKKLNLETVAEGIETKEQLEFLRDMGCDVGQGYYYARPLPEGEFLDKWHQEK